VRVTYDAGGRPSGSAADGQRGSKDRRDVPRAGVHDLRPRDADEEKPQVGRPEEDRRPQQGEDQVQVGSGPRWLHSHVPAKIQLLGVVVAHELRRQQERQLSGERGGGRETRA